jgi:ABC-type transporter Mla subunit MlaD
MDDQGIKKQLNRTLRKLLVKALWLRVASGFLSFLAVSSWIFVVLAGWKAFTEPPPLSLALWLSRIILALLAGAFVAFVVVPVLRMPSLRRLASQVEHKEDFKDMVVAAYEFSQDEQAAAKYNPHLVEEVIRRAVEAVFPLRAQFVFLGNRSIALVPVASAGLLVLLVLSFATPRVLLDAGKLLVDPRNASAAEHRANIFAFPGDVTILAGSDVKVTGIDFGDSEDQVEIHFSRSNGFWKSEPTEPEEVKLADGTLEGYSYTFKSLRSSLTYYFRAGADRSAAYRITVVNKPIVTKLEIIRTPPAYTGEKPDTVIDSGGNIQALEGTRIDVSGRCNNALASASVVFAKDRAALAALAAKGEARRRSGRKVSFRGSEFMFGFDALEDGVYTILLEDSLGYENDDPLVYSIEVFKDDPPTIDVVKPGGDATLPRNRLVDVGIVASDDYGISEAAIYYRKGGEGDFARREIPLGGEKGKKEINKGFTWDLSDIPLFPGNAVEYYMEVKDNNVATGPGVARSRVYQIMVPTMAELYDQVAQEDEKRSELLDQSLEQGEEFKKRIEKLEREFKKTENFDWSQKKEIDKALEGQKQIAEKLDEVRKSLDKTLEELSNNKMTSQEIGEKLEEISKLLEQINNEALEKYMENLKKAITQMDPSDVEEALKKLSLSADDLLRKLERTAELLKAVAKEQEMEELVRKSRDLMEKQKDLLDETKSAGKNDTDKLGELSRRQQKLAKEAAAMKEAMKKFSKKLGPEEREIAKQLDAAAENMSENATPSKMTEAAKKLRAGRKNAAAEDEKDALDDLISLFSRMSSCKSGMERMSAQRHAVHLQKYAKQALDISFKQEELIESLRKEAGARREAAALRSLAERQQSYLKATEKVADEIYDISKQTLSVSPVILQSLGEALSAMRQSIFNLERGRLLYSIPPTSRALASLNQATIEMLRAAKSCSSGSGSKMGMQEMLEQLLSGQNDVLKQSKEMLALEMLKEKLRMERQAKMKRLAAAQRSLQELARRIEKQLKDDKASLGRMDKILEDMEKVIENLEGGNLDRKTLDHEERILSRLLDAQRSVHTRDYERKRESMTAGDVFSRGAPGSDGKSREQQLREEIKRAMKLKAPGEFEDLIRIYFRAIAEGLSGGNDRTN